MPCSDSSSSIVFRLDPSEKFISFDFAKITCGQEITASTGYAQYCQGKALDEILKIPFEQIKNDLDIQKDEDQFILYMEWDILRVAIVQYLGMEGDPLIDRERCQISAIEHTEEGVEIALIILPPQELPKILPCNKGPKQ